MKKLLKKGFTIVELVIVIAVIAILAAVLIPTFAGVVDKANQSAALQKARSTLSSALNMSSTGSLAGKKATGEYQTMIVVDGYAFGYTGNQLEQIDYPTSETSVFYNNKTEGKNTFNAILMASENIVAKADDAANYTLLTSENAPADWATNWKSYYTKSSTTYAAVSAAEAPTYGKDTYYVRKDVSFEVKNVQNVITKWAKGTNEIGCTNIASIENVTLDGDTYYLNYTKTGETVTSAAKIYLNSDFAKSVVIFTTFGD